MQNKNRHTAVFHYVDCAASKKIRLRSGRAGARANLQDNPHACRGRNTVNISYKTLHAEQAQTIYKYTHFMKICQVLLISILNFHILPPNFSKKSQLIHRNKKHNINCVFCFNYGIMINSD